MDEVLGVTLAHNKSGPNNKIGPDNNNKVVMASGGPTNPIQRK